MSDKKMTDLQVMDKMATDNKDIRLAPLSNIKRSSTGKNGYGEIVIAVDNGTIIDMAGGKEFVGGLFLADKKQFLELKQDREGEG